MKEYKVDLDDFSDQIFRPIAKKLGSSIQKRVNAKQYGDPNKNSKWKNFAKKGLSLAGKGINYITQDHSKDGGINWLGLAEKGIGLASMLL